MAFTFPDCSRLSFLYRNNVGNEDTDSYLRTIRSTKTVSVINSVHDGMVGDKAILWARFRKLQSRNVEYPPYSGQMPAKYSHRNRTDKFRGTKHNQ